MTDTPLTDEATHKLEDLGVPLPEPIEIEGVEEQRPADAHPGVRILSGEEGLDFLRSIGFPIDELMAIGDEIDKGGFIGGTLGETFEPDEVVPSTTGAAIEFGADLGPVPKLETPRVGLNPKDALGALKPDPSVVPPAAILHLASAMMDGAVKYGPFNWRDNPVLARVYIAAAMRHLMQLLDGEDFDPVSGVHHAGHAMACMAIFTDAFETGNLVDDRPSNGAAGTMIRSWNKDTKFQ